MNKKIGLFSTWFVCLYLLLLVVQVFGDASIGQALMFSFQGIGIAIVFSLVFYLLIAIVIGPLCRSSQGAKSVGGVVLSLFGYGAIVMAFLGVLAAIMFALTGTVHIGITMFIWVPFGVYLACSLGHGKFVSYKRSEWV